MTGPKDEFRQETLLDTGLVEHLLESRDGLCWWCRTRPADSREHKFKRSDLARLWSADGLFWHNTAGDQRVIRGLKRSRGVRFSMTMCAHCNNARSQPFDQAYAIYTDYVRTLPFDRSSSLGIDFSEIFGSEWEGPQLDVARYYVKHFGCRMAEHGVRIPDSMRAFLDGASAMEDVQLALVNNAEVRQDPVRQDGLSISQDLVMTDRRRTRIEVVVMAAYVCGLGVRFEWREADDWEESPDSFFGHVEPVINQFVNELHLLTLAHPEDG